MAASNRRLRVFVSSVIEELENERAAVQRAIERLRLIPVMLDAEMRSYTPRSIYKAYLEQSDLFVGIYGRFYGSTAPDLDVSNLEDEYLTSGTKPKLIYVQDEGERDARLEELLDLVRSDDRVSYKPFRTPGELGELLQDDLALLLTERFYGGSADEGSNQSIPQAPLPVQVTPFIGREREKAELVRWLSDPDVRLITLIGPGGIGKTRLAIEAVRASEDRFEDGVMFVSLAALKDPTQVAGHLMDVFGVKETTADAESAILKWVSERQLLLVLDNFEQLLDATPLVARLLEAGSGVKVLVTSRAVLRVRGENEFPVPPMQVPSDEHEDPAGSEAVALFVERARHIRPNLDLGEETLKAIAGVCRRLDGLPLAIELAAARVKVMAPEMLLRRLGRRLEPLVKGPHDLPERQQTLRATIEWSFDLLNDEERLLFARLAVFRRGATLDAIETVCVIDDDVDVLEGLASLIEKSLLRQELSDTGDGRSWMLETIREFAVELSEASGESMLLRDRHASYYQTLCSQAQEGTTGAEQQIWFARIEADYPNIRAAAEHLLARGKAGLVAEMAWDLTLFVWVRGHMADARAACEAALRSTKIDPLHRAYALAAGGTAIFWQGGIGESVPMFVEAKALFEEHHDRRGVATCLLVLGLISPEIEGVEEAEEKLLAAIRIFEELEDEGWQALALLAYCWIMMLLDRHEGKTEMFERSVEIARRLGAELTLGMALGNLGQHRRWQGRLEEALDLQVQAVRPLRAAEHVAAMGYTFQNVAETFAAMGADADAVQMVAAGERAVEELDVLEFSYLANRRTALAEVLRTRLGDEAYDRACAAGRSLTLDEAIASMQDRRSEASIPS